MAIKNKIKGLILATAGLAGIVSGCSTTTQRTDAEKVNVQRLIQERDSYKIMFEVNNAILKIYEKQVLLNSYGDKTLKGSQEGIDKEIDALQVEITNLRNRLDTYLEKNEEKR